jgi:hypothetical protein
MVNLDANPLPSVETTLYVLEAQRKGSIAELFDNEQHRYVLFLGLVDDTLRFRFSVAENYRPLAVEYLYQSHLLGQLNAVLEQLGFTRIDLTSSRHDVFSLLDSIRVTRSKDLFGYLWLYIHFCRADIEIKRLEFCNLLSINIRSLQRYQQSALEKLNSSIIRAELAGQQRRYQLRLSEVSGHLPVQSKASRQHDALQFIQQYCLSDLAHVAICGPSGSGKTYLAARFAHASLESYDCISWVQSPVPYSDIDTQIAASVIWRFGGRFHPHESKSRCLVVIDDADSWMASLTHLEVQQFFLRYRFATVICTMRGSMPSGLGLVFVHTSEPLPDELIAQERLSHGLSSPTYQGSIASIVMPSSLLASDRKVRGGAHLSPKLLTQMVSFAGRKGNFGMQEDAVTRVKDIRAKGRTSQPTLRLRHPGLAQAMYLIEANGCDDDLMGKARVLSSVSVHLTQIADFAQASMFLAQAKNIQLRICDQSGLLITEHNVNQLGDMSI